MAIHFKRIFFALGVLTLSGSARAQSAPDWTSPDLPYEMMEDYHNSQMRSLRIQDVHTSDEWEAYMWTQRCQSDFLNGVPVSFAMYGSDAVQATQIEKLAQFHQTEKTCGNIYAPRYDVPIGYYDGNNLVGILEQDQVGPQGVLIPSGIQVMNGTIDRKAQCGGWTFEQTGMLYTTVQATGTINGPNTICTALIRMQYESPSLSQTFYQPNSEQVCTWTEPGAVYPQGCLSDSAAHCSLPSKVFWSQSGQVLIDMSNVSAPVIHYPNGDIEVMGFQGNSMVHNANYGGTNRLIAYGMSNSGLWYTQKKIDHNGNTTQYLRDSNGSVASIVAPNGKVTNFLRNNRGCVTEIDDQGPLGVKQSWKMTWDAAPRHYNPNDPNAFGTDITCGTSGINYSFVPEDCGIFNSQDFYTLQSLTEPDGRSYQFTYGLWGNLTQISTPDGLVEKFGYSSPNNVPPNTSIAGYVCEGNPFTSKLSQTEYPQGLSGPAYTTTWGSDTQIDTLHQGPCSGVTGSCIADCPFFGNRLTTKPDGSVVREVTCAGTQPTNGLENKLIATEVLVNNVVVEGVYYGDLATGTLWYQGNYSNNSLLGSSPPPLEDFLVTQIKHVRDGLVWWEKFTYDVMTATSGGITALTTPATVAMPTTTWYRGAQPYRSFGNVLVHAFYADCSGAPCGTALEQTVNTYQAGAYQSLLNPPYVNIAHLVLTSKVEDGGGAVFTRTDKGYDEAGLVVSSQPGLTTTYIGAGPPGGLRGNDTSTTKYLNASAATGPIKSATTFFDNGATKSTQNPLDLSAGRLTTNATAFDFGSCYTSVAPTPYFSGGGGSGAAGTCTASGTVSSCSVTSAGSGYTSAPTVALQGGAGSGATGTATLKPTGIGPIQNAWGIPFGGIPTITISGGGGTGGHGTVTSMGVVFYPGASDSIGSGYTSAPSCSFSGGGGTGATCGCNMVYLQGGLGSWVSCTVTNPGSGYTSVPTVAISGGGGTGLHVTVGISPLGVTTTPGSGYTTPPTATYSTGLNGSVFAPTVPLAPTGIASITVTNGGSGYTSTNSSHQTITTTVANALNQSITTVTECYTGATLSVTDLNGSASCKQYDGLGRLVETAAPGDTLAGLPVCTGTSNPGSCYVRDTNSQCQRIGTLLSCFDTCPTAGTAVGNGGAGATAWVEYFPFGIGGVTYNQARTVTHSRDGTPDGLKQVHFVDGLLRAFQQCSEVDPSTNSSNSAICTHTLYDVMGRPWHSFLPFYASAFPSAVVAIPGNTDQYTLTGYDALGRVTNSQLMLANTGVLPPTVTHYTSGGGLFITNVTDANSCESQSRTDVLGRVVEHDVQSNACTSTPSWYATTMTYDPAGRLRNINDPAGNVTSFVYDGLSNKTQVTDPDRGTWTFVYNNNSEGSSYPIKQTDARGAITYLTYDFLNRITLRDLPYLKNGTTWVSGTPGEEDEFTYWDGNVPATCYSCDDHCSTTTTNTCDTSTLACTHTGTACANPDQ
jgi:YD repeat-containing protein